VTARLPSTVLLLAGLAANLVGPWGFAHAEEPVKYGPYTEAQMTEILVGIFSDWQGDKTEKLILVTDVGGVFVFKGTGTHEISISLTEIIRTLARKETSIWQITDVFHNHNNPREGFSQSDRALAETLERVGIKAGFHIFYPENRRIKSLRGKPGKRAFLERHAAVRTIEDLRQRVERLERIHVKGLSYGRETE